jgi:hypothetical protein
MRTEPANGGGGGVRVFVFSGEGLVERDPGVWVEEIAEVEGSEGVESLFLGWR